MAMLAIGYKVVLIPKYEPEQFANYVNKYHPTVVLSIPGYWEAMLESGIKADMSCFEHIYYGGEGMSNEKEKEINDYIINCGSKTPLCKGLGSTELMAAATQSYPECNPIGSVGIPLVRVNCKVENPETGEELHYREEGELCFTGPTLMLGYYNNQTATDEIIRSGNMGDKWLHTGDIGYVDEDGIVYVTGRIKRIIMTKDESGQVTKMFPDRIEKAVCSVDKVETCCAIGIPDPDRINYPKIFVTLKSNESPENIKSEILESVSHNLPNYMLPKEIEILDEMPRTSRGKIDYRALEDKNRDLTP
jgi:long-chain acyl-CoA synthetase